MLCLKLRLSFICDTHEEEDETEIACHEYGLFMSLDFFPNFNEEMMAFSTLLNSLGHLLESDLIPCA